MSSTMPSVFYYYSLSQIDEAFGSLDEVLDVFGPEAKEALELYAVHEVLLKNEHERLKRLEEKYGDPGYIFLVAVQESRPGY